MRSPAGLNVSVTVITAGSIAVSGVRGNHKAVRKDNPLLHGYVTGVPDCANYLWTPGDAK